MSKRRYSDTTIYYPVLCGSRWDYVLAIIKLKYNEVSCSTLAWWVAIIVKAPLQALLLKRRHLSHDSVSDSGDQWVSKCSSHLYIYNHISRFNHKHSLHHMSFWQRQGWSGVGTGRSWMAYTTALRHIPSCCSLDLGYPSCPCLNAEYHWITE